MHVFQKKIHFQLVKGILNKTAPYKITARKGCFASFTSFHCISKNLLANKQLRDNVEKRGKLNWTHSKSDQK